MVSFLTSVTSAIETCPPLAVGKPHRGQRLDRRTPRPVELHANRNVLARLRIVQQPRRRAVQSHLDRLRHRRRRHAVQRGLVQIDHHVVLGLRIFDVPVHIHHAGRRLEDLLDLLRQLHLLLVVGPIHFRHQRLQHRRPGRNLGHLQPRTVLVADRDQPRPQPLGDVVALRAALMAVQQVHLDVRLVRAAPQEIMPHQSVEVVWPRRARVNLVVHHFRLLAQVLPQLLRHARGLLQRRAVGHVDDHLELALVVEGQHLHLHQLERHQRTREQQQHHHAAEEHPPPRCALQQRIHDSPVEPAWSSLPSRVHRSRARRSDAAAAAPTTATPRTPRPAKTAWPPTRPPESAACTAPSARAQTPSAEWRQSP